MRKAPAILMAAFHTMASISAVLSGVTIVLASVTEYKLIYNSLALAFSLASLGCWYVIVKEASE